MFLLPFYIYCLTLIVCGSLTFSKHIRDNSLQIMNNAYNIEFVEMEFQPQLQKDTNIGVKANRLLDLEMTAEPQIQRRKGLTRSSAKLMKLTTKMSSTAKAQVTTSDGDNEMLEADSRGRQLVLADRVTRKEVKEVI